MIIEHLKTTDKEKILKAEKNILSIGQKQRMIADCALETRSSTIFQVLNKNEL